jgi:diketogulonate reductase-like aldo/keto reductase
LSSVRTTTIGKTSVPVLGQGTWQLGDRPAKRQQEIAALRAGIELGLTLIDTAELYGSGSSEQLVAEAIAGRRDQVFLVTKVLPSNATSRRKIVAACEASLRRLRVDRVDLYLLHWRSGEDLGATVDTFNELAQAGRIGRWGVSNFDVDDLEELRRIPGGDQVACNQVLYNLTRRGIEFDLLPAARSSRVNVMAYTPIEQGRILGNAALQGVAARHGATAVQVALAWVLRQDGVVAIPRASSAEHVKENAAAADIALTAADLRDLDAAFPPPTKRRSLEMI